jgi:hypothetical protein
MYLRFGAIACGCGSTKPCLPTVSASGSGELFMAVTGNDRRAEAREIIF